MAEDFEASKEVKDRWCLLAKSSLGSSVRGRASKNHRKAMAHLLFPFIMSEAHRGASHSSSLLAAWSLVSKKPAKKIKDKKIKSENQTE